MIFKLRNKTIYQDSYINGKRIRKSTKIKLSSTELWNNKTMRCRGKSDEATKINQDLSFIESQNISNDISDISMPMRYTLTDAITNFVSQKYHISKGTRRTEVTLNSYRLLAELLFKTIYKHNINHDLIKLNLNDYTKDPIKTNKIKSLYKNIAETIKNDYSNISHNTLKKRLNVLKYSFYLAEKEMNIKTYAEPFDLKVKFTKREVMSEELYKKTIKKAFSVLAMENVADDYHPNSKRCSKTGQFKRGKYNSSYETHLRSTDIQMKKRGAFTFLLVAFTSARIKDVMSWKFSENLSVQGDTYLLSYKPNKTKHAVINIPLPLQINEYLNEEIKKVDNRIRTDYFLNGVSYAHILRSYRRFIESIPDFNQEITTHKDMCDGQVITKNKKLYEVLTFHNIRATFITQMVQKGVDLETIMNFSGHTNIQTLSKKYTNISDEHKDKMYKNFIETLM